MFPLLTTLERWVRRQFARSPAGPPDLLRVPILDRHLAQGLRRAPWHCPAALACNEAVGDAWCITPPVGMRIINHRHRIVYRLRAEDSAWCEAWDRAEPVEPCTFILGGPVHPNETPYLEGEDVAVPSNPPEAPRENR